MTTLRLVHPATPRATSIAAVEDIRATGNLGRSQMRVVEILAAIGPATASEVEEYDRDDTARVRGHRNKRLSELRDLGCVVECGSRDCRVTGRRAVTWALSGRMPARRDRPVPLATRLAHAERENERLRAENQTLRLDLALARAIALPGVE